MTLIHMSGEKIEGIKKDWPVFADVLFFSTDGYCPGRSDYEYHVEVDESEIIANWKLDDYYDTEEFQNAISDITDIYDFVSADDAYELICGRMEQDEVDHDDYEDIASLGWEIQVIQAKLARAFGFRFVESTDEHGAVYAASMFGRESELVLQ